MYIYITAKQLRSFTLYTTWTRKLCSVLSLGLTNFLSTPPFLCWLESLPGSEAGEKKEESPQNTSSVLPLMSAPCSTPPHNLQLFPLCPFFLLSLLFLFRMVHSQSHSQTDVTKSLARLSKSVIHPKQESHRLIIIKKTIGNIPITSLVLPLI